MSRHSHPRQHATGRFTRLRVVLAAGLVLGVGATVTLASWNDSETSTAAFTAGQFDIVGSTDGTTFAQHATAATAAGLTFSAPVTAMSPGSTAYSLFRVKTLAGSVAGTLGLTAAAPNATSGTGLGAALTYGVKTIAGTTCDAAAYAAGTAVVAAGSPVTTGQAAGSTVAVTANGAAPVNYCFAVTLPQTAGNEVQGKTGTLAWTFTATSA